MTQNPQYTYETHPKEVFYVENVYKSGSDTEWESKTTVTERVSFS